jgi:hypothetical protein
MAKLKEIKESSPVWMTTSFIDMVSLIDKSKTNKYVKMISNLVEKNMNERISNWDNYDIKFRVFLLPKYFGYGTKLR